MTDPTSSMTKHSRIRQRLALIGEVVQCWEPLLWLAVVLLAALILAIRLKTGQNADGLLQTLMSLDHLTIFFWEQNRFANLLPLLTSLITDPTANAQVQLAIRIMTGIAAPLLFTAPLAQSGNFLRVGRMTLLATGLALAFMPERFLWEWFIEASPYGTSFALGGCALLLFDAVQWRDGSSATTLRIGGLLLTIAAYMVNASLVLFTAPFFGPLGVMRGSRLAVEFGLASVVGGIVTATVANSVSAPNTAFRFGESFIGLTYYLETFMHKPGYFLGAMFAVFALSIGMAKTMKQPLDKDLLGYGVMMTATFAFAFIAISLSSWVIANDMQPRYLVPLYILAASLGAISILTVLDTLVNAGHESRFCLGLCVATLFMASQRSLPPVPSDAGIVDAKVRATAAAAANNLTRFKLDGIAGDYWIVWPAIFLAEQRAHDLGQPPRHIFGATYRGEARRDALQAHLLEEGHLDFACIDLREEPCRRLVSKVIDIPLSVSELLLPRHPLGETHSLSALRLSISPVQDLKD